MNLLAAPVLPYPLCVFLQLANFADSESELDDPESCGNHRQIGWSGSRGWVRYRFLPDCGGATIWYVSHHLPLRD